MRELGVLIPIIALLIPIVAIWTRHQRQLKMKELEILEKTRGTLDADQAQRLARLEERVQVLERIATDRQLGLADEIRRLEEM
jgi:hypothetical protein